MTSPLNRNVNLLFWIFTSAVFLVLLLPKMIQEGMFMDGMLYSCVAHNLANGYGTFWFPKFNEIGLGGLSTFHEHPPLVFGIQALFFKVFGNSFYVEKAYSLFTALVTAWLIVKVWRLLFHDKPEFAKMGWLPVLLWIIMPIIYFTYQNNLMENSMSIFSLLSVYFGLRILLLKDRVVLNLIGTGLAIFLASFSKGIPGFFTIGIFGLWWLIHRTISFKQMVIYTSAVILIPIVIYLLIILLNADAAESLSNYLFKRAFHRIQNAHTVDSRFHVIWKLFMETLPSIMFTVGVMIVSRFRVFRQKSDPTFLKNIAFIFAVGLSGTLPLMLTLVQKSFYFIHALPYFAIGLAMVTVEPLSSWIQKINPQSAFFRVFYFVVVFFLIAVLGYSAQQIGKTERDHAMLHDVHMLGSLIPNSATIGIHESMHENYTMHCYMVRYYNITMDFNASTPLYILLEEQMDPPADIQYKLVDIPLETYKLFKYEAIN